MTYATLLILLPPSKNIFVLLRGDVILNFPEFYHGWAKFV